MSRITWSAEAHNEYRALEKSLQEAATAAARAKIEAARASAATERARKAAQDADLRETELKTAARNAQIELDAIPLRMAALECQHGGGRPPG